MEATLGGQTIASEKVIPSEKRFWQVSVLGEGLGTVSIFYDGKLYRAYSVNFTESSSMMVTDNSEDFGG